MPPLAQADICSVTLSRYHHVFKKRKIQVKIIKHILYNLKVFFENKYLQGYLLSLFKGETGVSVNHLKENL